MNIQKIKFPLKEIVGEKGLLIAIAEVFEYKDGKRTDKVIGTRYDVLLQEKKYEQLSIKVMDKPIITAKELEGFEKPPIVCFGEVYGKIYLLNNQIKMSVTAQTIYIDEEVNIDDEI